jgi:predicted AlkP superfamily pyrophosphatase or phosphodiesterase
MIKILLSLALCSLLAIVSEAQRKAVFIIVDGIPADVIKKIDTPYLDDIAGAHGFADAYVGGAKNSYSQSPTVSAVGYNHVLTGVWSNKHNVYDNSIKAPNYNYWHIFRIIKSQNKDARTAIFSSWLDNRTKLIGETLPEAGSFRFDYSVDGLELDSVQFPHANPNYMFDVDEKISEEAAAYILREGPDISWVYLQFTDDMGHTYGDDPRFYDAVRKADNQVGRIWKAVKERIKKNGEQWMVLVTTDHGRDSVTGKDHGGQSDRERRGWIVTNGEPLNAYFQQNPGTVDIAPSILKFMEISPPEAVQNELDGISFIGKISLCNVKAVRHGNTCTVNWTPQIKDGIAEIFFTTTNNFAKGGKDNYRPVGKVDVALGSYTFDLQEHQKTDFFKILVKAPHNTINTWVVSEEMLKKFTAQGK